MKKINRVLEALEMYRDGRSEWTEGAAVTAAELAVWEDLDRAMVGRRLPDLVRHGLVQRDIPRICSVNQIMSITWRAL